MWELKFEYWDWIRRAREAEHWCGNESLFIGKWWMAKGIWPSACGEEFENRSRSGGGGLDSLGMVRQSGDCQVTTYWAAFRRGLRWEDEAWFDLVPIVRESTGLWDNRYHILFRSSCNVCEQQPVSRFGLVICDDCTQLRSPGVYIFSAAEFDFTMRGVAQFPPPKMHSF